MSNNTKFTANSNFEVNMSSNGNNNFEVRTANNNNVIPVKTNDGSVIIPIATSKDTKMTIDSSSGINYLKYIIDNETGNYLVMVDNVLRLYSKSGNLLSAVSIPKELPEYHHLRNKYLYVDSSGNLEWTTGGGSGSEYYSGVAISIDEERHINLVYDTNTLYITLDGKLAVDLEKVQAKLVEGDNIIINGNKISAVDTKYTAGEGIRIDDENKIHLAQEVNDYYYLKNKPSINGIELIGAMLGKDLKLDIVEYMTYKQYLSLETYERKLYFVCKKQKDVEAEDCWRIYLQHKLIGEWEITSGMVTLPKFPFRFPFRFSGKWQNN